MEKTEITILGAGPAGLAAAYLLLKQNKKVVIFEADNQVGGISKTIKFDGCYFDIGGHRFHTNIKEVDDLWKEILKEDFLLKPRLSRIYYNGRFFNYPLTPINAIFGLGVIESAYTILSYIHSHLFPQKPEKNFEQWVSNRFGKRLFNAFFKTYTEKVWGISCREIQAEWAEQRIQSLSLAKAILGSLPLAKNNKIKTLINKFYYPKYGPGMMYEKMAEQIQEMGGKIYLNAKVKKIIISSQGEATVVGNGHSALAKNIISTIPISNLIEMIEPFVPKNVNCAAEKLKFRSFIEINAIFQCPNPFPDNWIYIHSPDVKIGRIQNYRNWSKYMVDDPKKTTLGLEYFCDYGDEFWKLPDHELIDFSLAELEKMRIVRKKDFLGGFVTKVSHAYPIYDKGYDEELSIVKKYLERYKNLQTIGRGGMFRYNNMDHSILSGIRAAKNILGEKNDIWEINT